MMARSARTRFDDLSERVWYLIERAESGCWLWRGAPHPSGYGRIKTRGREQYAHVAVYELPSWWKDAG